MAELLFTLELRGKAGPTGSDPSRLHATTSGKGPKGENVAFESDVALSDGTFEEHGTIRYGSRGQVKFETVGAGHIGPSPVADIMAGAVVWTVTEGDGEFNGEKGYITSNFTVSKDGDVVDNHYARIYLT